MPRINEPTCRFLRDERGAVSIEYGLIAVLIAVAMLVALTNLGQTNTGSWSDSAAKLGNAMRGK
jgi:Flp pilus assembly pilin Flp